jgi:hypothetical protein
MVYKSGSPMNHLIDGSPWMPPIFNIIKLKYSYVMDRGGQNRTNRLKPTDPCDYVWSGQVVSVGTGPAGLALRFRQYYRVGSGCLSMTRENRNPNRTYMCRYQKPNYLSGPNQNLPKFKRNPSFSYLKWLDFSIFHS